jgi:hypothetical protein
VDLFPSQATYDVKLQTLRDVSGRGRHATSGNGARFPELKAVTNGGRNFNVLQFDGRDTGSVCVLLPVASHHCSGVRSSHDLNLCVFPACSLVKRLASVSTDRTPCNVDGFPLLFAYHFSHCFCSGLF